MLDPKYIDVLEPEEIVEEAAPDEALDNVLPLRAKRDTRARRSDRARKTRELWQDNPNGSAPPPEALRRKVGLIYRATSWLSIRTAVLCGAFYDLQMQIGKGVRLVEHRLQLPNFPTGAPPLKVAYLSDLHYGPTSGRLALRQAWKLVRDARPDAIFLGGDYLFADERGLPLFLKELQRFQNEMPAAGIYACLGNHDYYAGRDTIVTCLEACGVKVLVNDAVPLPTPWKGVWVAGVDDLKHGAPNLHDTLEKVSPDASTLLLAHEPDICADPNLRRCAITLCGHTHGGQICLPGGEPLYVPTKAGKDYAHGLIRHAGQWLYVSRGVGVSGIAMRMFCPPDVAVFTFTGRGPRQVKPGVSRAVPVRSIPREPVLREPVLDSSE
jgi:predicted MPP superfamily phosphohydrolase